MHIIENLLLNNNLAEIELPVSPKDFEFASNVLEANVINIFILASGVCYVGHAFLTSVLKLRQQKIIEAIQEAEDSLKYANVRLSEAEKQMAQAKIVVEQIKKEAESVARKVKDTILAQGKLDIERLTATGKSSIETAEVHIKKQIQQYITKLTLKRVASQLRNCMDSRLQSKLIDANISQLGGHV
uniref:ATP synthase CF0 subunit I n=1 Tax=Cryptomonas sp. SAG 977-2f TaxID=279061 RepID=A0A679C9Y1_9CRYP|nr:ATP synthase CF0 subunit I [Cryptomonas sp. SAG 977-2f]